MFTEKIDIVANWKREEKLLGIFPVSFIGKCPIVVSPKCVHIALNAYCYVPFGCLHIDGYLITLISFVYEPNFG